MASTAWSLLMKLQGDASGLQRAVASSETSLRGLGKTTQSIGRGMESAGRTMTVAVTAPLLAAGGASLKMASDYETAFAGVEKTLGGDWGQDEVSKLSDDIRKMAREDIPLAATELAAIGEAGGALGIAKDTMLEFIETTALLSVTTDLTSDAAAVSLGKLNTGLQLTKGEFTALGDALVFLGNRGASTESEILSMAEGFAGTAGLFDLSIASTLGWSAALANVGEEAEAGASSMSRFFQETFKHAQAGGDELALMADIAGTTADKFKTAMEDDISGALQTFIVGLGELTQAEQLATLEALGFNDVRITRAILKLTSNTDNLTSSLNNAEEGFAGSNAMGIEAAKRFETFASQMQFLKNELVDIGIEFGTMLLPIIREDVLPVLRDGLDVLRDWVDWFKALPPEGRKAVVMWAGIAAAMGPVLFIGGKILGTFGSIIGAAGRMAGALGRIGGGAGQGAMSRLTAQPVFVTNWPPGMAAGGGLAGGAAAAGGRGWLGRIATGALRLLPVLAAAQMADEFHDEISGFGKELHDQLGLDGDWNPFRGLDLSDLEWPLGPKNAPDWARFEPAPPKVMSGPMPKPGDLAADAASFDTVLTREFGGKLDKLATKDVIEHLRRTNEMGLEGVGTSFQIGLANGLDPLGDTATRILARAEDPKAPEVMNEIQGHLLGLEEIQAAYLANGDVHLAAKVQTNIDTLNRLIGKEDEHRAVTAHMSAQAASNDAAMIQTARTQTTTLAGRVSDVSTRVQWVADGMGGVRREIQLMHGTLAAKNFSPIIYNTVTGVGGNINGPAPALFHSGTWDTGPHGGLAMLHDEELVLPKRDAKAFRSGDFWDKIGGGGKSGDVVLQANVKGLIKAETPADLVRPMRALARTGHLQKRTSYRYEQ